MTRFDFAKILLTIRTKFPVSRQGVACSLSIDEDKHTVAGHISRNKEIRRKARRKGFA